MDTLPDKKILKYFKKFIDFGAYPYYFEDKNRYIDRINKNSIMTIPICKLINHLEMFKECPKMDLSIGKSLEK